jgi:hypothetical protein
MMKYSFATCLLVCLGLIIPGCGGTDVGEACQTRGAQDECVSGAVCDLDGSSSTEPVCLTVCKDSMDCATTEDCNGVSGSNIKACTPKKK